MHADVVAIPPMQMCLLRKQMGANLLHCFPGSVYTVDRLASPDQYKAFFS